MNTDYIMYGICCYYYYYYLFRTKGEVKQFSKKNSPLTAETVVPSTSGVDLKADKKKL